MIMNNYRNKLLPLQLLALQQSDIRKKVCCEVDYHIEHRLFHLNVIIHSINGFTFSFSEDYDYIHVSNEYKDFKKISPKKKNRESKWPSSHGQRSSAVRFPNHRSLFSEEKRLQPSKRDRRQLGRICSCRDFL